MTSFESFNSHHERAEQISEIKRDMQIALILRGAPEEKHKEQFDHHVLDWIDRYSEAYANAFELLRERRPNLVEDWVEKREEVMRETVDLMSENGVHLPEAA